MHHPTGYGYIHQSKLFISEFFLTYLSTCVKVAEIQLSEQVVKSVSQMRVRYRFLGCCPCRSCLPWHSHPVTWSCEHYRFGTPRLLDPPQIFTHHRGLSPPTPPLGPAASRQAGIQFADKRLCLSRLLLAFASFDTREPRP